MPQLHVFMPDATDSVACHHSLCILNTLQEEEEEDDDEDDDEEDEEGDWLDCRWRVEAPERPSEVDLPEQKDQLFLPNKVSISALSLFSVHSSDCENSILQVLPPVVSCIACQCSQDLMVNDTLAAILTPL